MPKFDKKAYAAQLAAGGVDPDTAESVAAKMAAAEGSDGDLFAEEAAGGPLTTNPAPPPVPASGKKSRGRAADKVLAAAVAIALDEPGGDDRTFMHSIMCQVGLPRSKVAGNEFERRSGRGILAVRAGKVFDGKNLVQQPIPYGPKPRLILAYLNTAALRNNSPVVPVGDSASQFMRMLGIQPGGGPRGSYTSFKKQAQALAACDMTLGYLDPQGQPQTYYGKPIESFSAWAPGPEGQKVLWPGVIRFSESYYLTLRAHAIPMDMRAIMALSESALAMDIYAMFSDRLHRIKGHNLLLHWANLKDQFGQEYQNTKDFRDAFLKALQHVLAVYPKARIKQVTGGLLLLPSPPPIPYKQP